LRWSPALSSGVVLASAPRRLPRPAHQCGELVARHAPTPLAGRPVSTKFPTQYVWSQCGTTRRCEGRPPGWGSWLSWKPTPVRSTSSSESLDLWAILRRLDGDEPGAAGVEAAVRSRPLMSWTNLGELADILERRSDADRARHVIRELRRRLTMDLPTEARVLEAARQGEFRSGLRRRRRGCHGDRPWRDSPDR